MMDENKRTSDICERLSFYKGIFDCFTPKVESTKEEVDAAITEYYSNINDACLEIEELRKTVRVLKKKQEPISDYEYWSKNIGDTNE